MSWDPQGLQVRVFEEVLGGDLNRIATVEASGIQGSPYDHVFVYLDRAALAEGPHLILSPAEEMGEGPGIFCGRYALLGEPVGPVELVPDADAAIAWVRESS